MTTMQIHETLTQNTPEWLAIRCGVWTASSIGDLLTAKGEPADNATSRALIQRIARERISGRPDADFQSRDMIRGHELEPIARDYYAKHYNAVRQVGFVSNEIDGIRVGCSPDGLVGERGGIEIKTRSDAVHFKEVLSGIVPPENMPQIQFTIMVTERDWWDYVGFCDGWPLIVRRVLPDGKMQDAIRQAIIAAEERVQEVIVEYHRLTHDFVTTQRIAEAQESDII